MSERRPMSRRPELWKLFVWGAIFLTFIVTKGRMIWIAAAADPTTALAILCVLASFVALVEGIWRRYSPGR